MSRPCVGALFLAGVLAGQIALPPVAAQSPPGVRQGPAFVPYVGLHLPANPLLQDDDIAGGWQGQAGLLMGGRLEFPAGPRLLLQGDAGYATSRVAGFGPGYEDFEVDGHFLALTGRVAYRLTGRRSPVALSVHGGGGLLRHWVSSPNPTYSTWPVAVAGASGRFRLAPQIELAVGAETQFYRAKFGGPEPRSTGQRDYRLTLGLWLPMQ